MKFYLIMVKTLELKPFAIGEMVSQLRHVNSMECKIVSIILQHGKSLMIC